MSKQPFIHLHTHSHYSLLDGLQQLPAMVKRAKEMGMPALALTDHGNLYGAIEFYKLCLKEGIKPIIGIEAYIANRTRFDKDPKIDNKRYHLTLLAKNEQGYKNLIKLSTKASLEGYYYKPRMDHDLLREHHQGLIALSGCFGGELSIALRAGNDKEARRVIALYQDIFGKENYFLEVWHDPALPGGMEVKSKLISLGRELNIPIVATQDSHYCEAEDREAHETLLAIQTSSDMTDQNRFSMGKGNYSFISTDEAYEKFKDNPEAVDNTQIIADMCDIKLELGKWVFPKYETKDGATYQEELAKLCNEGLAWREVAETSEVRERINYELKVIGDKGYDPFYLVTADLMRYARENGIYTTVRGSGAGSIVAYLTGITNVNPIEYQLPFERFLNPYRPSPPDFDMDYADNRRDEVIEYTIKKYGRDKVAQIGTFGTMLARGVVRDVARALAYPYAIGDKISRLIPLGSQGFPMTIARALELEPDLAKLYKEDADTKRIIDLGRKLEGCVRHISVHAAGVVIAPTLLTDFVPLQLDPKGGKIITQYDMHAVEDAGLLKFDFLGIRNLAILADAVERVGKIHNIKIDIEKIPLDNKKTFEMLARGETEGTFQLGGTAMTKYLVELRPTTIHDINAMVALFRPGPMNNIPEYISRKHGKSPITYYHPKMKNFLEKSYGILVYQDDLLYTALELAGYTWETVDKFRKAVGKKIPAEMKKQHVIFVDGCMKHSDMRKKEAEGLWDLFEPFQGYGFNKAHAACYGRVAYQTAYMKANYPAEYMSAVLTAESGDIDKISEVIAECKRMGFNVLPPDVNESFSDFTVVVGKETPTSSAVTGQPPGAPKEQEEVGVPAQKDKIRFGLRSIKNFGEEIGKAIIHERKTNGNYKNYSDFLTRVQHRNLTKKSLEALVMAGALDNFGERGQMMANIESALEFSRLVGKGTSNQESLFGAEESIKPEFRMQPAPPTNPIDKLRWEKELLGLYVSGHPLDTHKAKLDKHEQTIDKIKALPENTPVLSAGLVTGSKMILTKKGDKMLFATMEDFKDSIELVCFSSIYEEIKELIVPGECVAIRGKVSHRNGSPSIVVEKTKKL